MAADNQNPVIRVARGCYPESQWSSQTANSTIHHGFGIFWMMALMKRHNFKFEFVTELPESNVEEIYYTAAGQN